MFSIVSPTILMVLLLLIRFLHFYKIQEIVWPLFHSCYSCYVIFVMCTSVIHFRQRSNVVELLADFQVYGINSILFQLEYLHCRTGRRRKSDYKNMLMLSTDGWPTRRCTSIKTFQGKSWKNCH